MPRRSCLCSAPQGENRPIRHAFEYAEPHVARARRPPHYLPARGIALGYGPVLESTAAMSRRRAARSGCCLNSSRLSLSRSSPDIEPMSSRSSGGGTCSMVSFGRPRTGDLQASAARFARLGAAAEAPRAGVTCSRGCTPRRPSSCSRARTTSSRPARRRRAPDRAARRERCRPSKRASATPRTNAPSCGSESASRSTPAVFVSRPGRCNQRRRISAARGSETARSRKPASI